MSIWPNICHFALLKSTHQALLLSSNGQPWSFVSANLKIKIRTLLFPQLQFLTCSWTRNICIHPRGPQALAKCLAWTPEPGHLYHFSQFMQDSYEVKGEINELSNIHIYLVSIACSRHSKLGEPDFFAMSENILTSV